MTDFRLFSEAKHKTIAYYFGVNPGQIRYQVRVANWELFYMGEANGLKLLLEKGLLSNSCGLFYYNIWN